MTGAPNPSRIIFRGFKFDRRTVAMIEWAEKKAGFKFVITQGSYSTGVRVSGGTHNGGGAVDFSVRNLAQASIDKMVHALRDAGFAAWHRHEIPGTWPEHCHAVAIGCPDLATAARNQVLDYDRKHDGLKQSRPDPTYHPHPAVIFDMKTHQPIHRPTFKES